MKAFEAAHSGVQLVCEDRRIISGVTVGENIILVQISKPVGWNLEKIYSHFPKLGERRKQGASSLSGGE